MAKTILEFLGLRTENHRYADFHQYFQACRCPFLAYEPTATAYCRKVKKATKEEIKQRGRVWATLGSCVVSDQDGTPIIICPHKLEMGDRFSHDVNLYFSEAPAVIHEVTLQSGRVDWVFRGLSVLDKPHTVALEIQALDTTATGGINDAKRAFERGEQDLATKSFEFGFNWKMSIKTIIFQVLTKFSETAALGWSYVLVCQDLFLEKMRELYGVKATSVSDLEPREILEHSKRGYLLVHAYRLAPGEVTHKLAGPERYIISRSELIDMLSLQTDARGIETRLEKARRVRSRLPLTAERIREHIEGCGVPRELRDPLLREL